MPHSRLQDKVSLRELLAFSQFCFPMLFKVTSAHQAMQDAKWGSPHFTESSQPHCPPGHSIFETSMYASYSQRPRPLAVGRPVTVIWVLFSVCAFANLVVAVAHCMNFGIKVCIVGTFLHLLAGGFVFRSPFGCCGGNAELMFVSNALEVQPSPSARRPQLQ